MKLNFTFLISFLLTNWAFGQTADSATTTAIINSFNPSFNAINSNAGGSIMDSKRQKRWITKDNVIIETYDLQLTQIEAEISDMESSECKALLKRDTATLRNIWQRDFTLDEPQNELQVGKNPIPYYTSLTRLIDKFTILDNVVYTSGHEYVQRLRSDGKVDESIKQDFFHMWVNKFGVWKLSTKN
jgi:hypothetical protein